MYIEPKQLYAELMALTNGSDVFYFQDFTKDTKKYRIFNYRLSTYTEFLKPSAMECRGIMFEVDNTGEMVRIASRPMQKFFNLNENPMTMNLDLSKVDAIEAKADGSLMSTYWHGDPANDNDFGSPNLHLKSKGSISSDQVIDSMKWLNKPENAQFKKDLGTMTRSGATVNLEWCAPFNRIVIGYPEPHLKVLNVRTNVNGRYVGRDLVEFYCEKSNMIERVDLRDLNIPEFVKQIPSMTDDIEGFVCRIDDLWFKVKTDKYISLHHTKDSITNPRRLFEVVVNEGADDLRSMFATDAVAISLIDKMQTQVSVVYNQIVATTERFYEANKDVNRKDFAIASQSVEVSGLKLMSLLMNKYIGREIDYKQFLIARYKELGFADASI